MRVSAKIGRGWWLWGIGYLGVVVAVVWWVLRARDWALAELTRPESTAAWETWRADVRAARDKPSPVERRVPNSAEPPALVLLRDYFGVMLGGAVIFSSLLYWVLAWFVTGIIRSHPPSATEEAD